MNARLMPAGKADLAKYLTEVSKALKEAAVRKASCLDGLPSELWKACATRYDQDTRAEKLGFDITSLFNDIERNGVQEGMGFSKGWICPIYKKNNARDIGNYRPITLLNADYKVMTRAIANRLAVVVEDVFHKDQAGFVPGHHIHEHTKLSKLMIDYANAEEVNGIIVALD